MTTVLNIPIASDADRREPAPGELELVRQLVNTHDWEDGSEEVPTPDALREWLAERGLLDRQEHVSGSDLRMAVEVREALRGVLLANNGYGSHTEPVETLNSVARLSPLVAHFDDDGRGALAPAGAGVPAALARLLGIAVRATWDGSWERLKACPEHDCRWAFYDHSRNRSKHWCRMEVCGNRAKARSYRERQRDAGR